MKYVIISGSHREKSQSEKVARFLSNRLREIGPADQVSVLSLSNNPLPLWDEEVGEGSPRWKALWEPFSEELSGADALVFVVPEWGGMVPPGFKNFLLLCGRELAHKPVLLVSVSAGIGGAYPISELRMSGYKNTHLSYLPEHLIIRQVSDVLNDGSINSALREETLRERIDHSLKLLGVYGEAFRMIRSTERVELGRYPYGM